MPNNSACFHEDFRIIELCDVMEQLLSKALRHKLLPRLIIHLLDEFLNRDILLNIDIHPIDHERDLS